LAYSLKRSEKSRQRKKQEKRFWIDDWQKKEGAFFWQGVLRKMYGKEAVRKKEE
jgi:hypothetical protein